jgi:hypothetical protein
MEISFSNTNHVIAVVMASVGLLDTLVAKFMLPSLLAKNPKNTQQQINVISNILQGTAFLFFAIAMYFYYMNPLMVGN